MNYKYGFILKEAEDYLRNIDFSHLDFIKAKDMKRLRLESDGGIIYIEEDVNATRTESFVKLLNENNIEVNIVSSVKWKKFPEKPYIYK